MAAVVVVTVAGFAVLGTAASATTASGTDPANDNGPDFNPRGDVVAFSVVNSTTSITVSATTRTFDNPASSNNWISFGSGILFGVDTNNDGDPEYVVVYENDGGGNVIAGVFNNDLAGTFLCDATPTFNAAAKTYSATFSASCVSSPASVELAVIFGYLTATTSSFDDTNFTSPASATSSTSTTTSTTSTSTTTSSTTTSSTTSTSTSTSTSTTSTTLPPSTTSSSAPATTTSSSAPATTTTTAGVATTSTTAPATTTTTAAVVAGEGTTTSTSAAASAAAATTTTTVAGANGNLPRTGAASGLLALLGLTLLSAGWAMATQRRRRTAA